MATFASDPISVTTYWEDPLVLLPRKKPQLFEKDQAIYGPTDPADSLFLVVEGAIKLSRVSESGRETVLDVESRESFFGISSMLGESTRGESAVALENSSVMEWPVDEIRQLMRRTPELGAALTRVVARKLAEAGDRIESFATDQIPRRLVKALLRLGARFGEPSGSPRVIRLIPLTHDLLAKHVGTSREIVTQHMSRLRRRGVVAYSRTGLEFDPSKLESELSKLR